MRKLLFTILGISALATVNGRAQMVDYASRLGGTNSSYTWENFVIPSGVSTGVDGTAGEWAGTTSPTNNGIAANGGASTNNLFYVPLTEEGTAAHPLEVTDFAGGAIYSFFDATRYQVSSSNVTSNFNTFVFQLNVGSGLTGPYGGAALDLLSAPSLELFYSDNTSEVIGAADFFLLQSSFPYYVAAFNINTTLNSLGFQWDLSGVSKTVVGYTVDFQSAYHGMIFGANATESSSIHDSTALVPEPSTWAMIVLAGSVMMIASIRNRRSRA